MLESAAHSVQGKTTLCCAVLCRSRPTCTAPRSCWGYRWMRQSTQVLRWALGVDRLAVCSWVGGAFAWCLGGRSPVGLTLLRCAVMHCAVQETLEARRSARKVGGVGWEWDTEFRGIAGTAAQAFCPPQHPTAISQPFSYTCRRAVCGHCLPVAQIGGH